MSAVSASSSSRPRGAFLWVDRCWRSTRQARRSETPSVLRTCSIASRRRAGLSSIWFVAIVVPRAGIGWGLTYAVLACAAGFLYPVLFIDGAPVGVTMSYAALCGAIVLPTVIWRHAIRKLAGPGLIACAAATAVACGAAMYLGLGKDHSMDVRIAVSGIQMLGGALCVGMAAIALAIVARYLPPGPETPAERA